MFSLERCRDIIGRHVHIDDVELTILRDELYGLAHVVADKIANHKGHGETPNDYSKPDYETAIELLSESEREDVEERAAIIEFEGGRNRGEAERRAIVSAFQNRTRKGFHN